jgi:hypothetical protein
MLYKIFKRFLALYYNMVYQKLTKTIWIAKLKPIVITNKQLAILKTLKIE